MKIVTKNIEFLKLFINISSLTAYLSTILKFRVKEQQRPPSNVFIVIFLVYY